MIISKQNQNHEYYNKFSIKCATFLNHPYFPNNLTIESRDRLFNLQRLQLPPECKEFSDREELSTALPNSPVCPRRFVYSKIITTARIHQNSAKRQHKMAREFFCQHRRHHGPSETNDMFVCESSSGSVLASEYAIWGRVSLPRLLSGIR